ncbi:hypothetical protein LCGC14_2395720, partial [marine sediment metagenome]
MIRRYLARRKHRLAIRAAFGLWYSLDKRWPILCSLRDEKYPGQQKPMAEWRWLFFRALCDAAVAAAVDVPAHVQAGARCRSQGPGDHDDRRQNMVSKIKEARAALEALLRSLTGTQAEVTECADAYALQAHVDACIKHNWSDLPANRELTVSQAEKIMRKCG